MVEKSRRRMTLLDTILLVSSAAIGLGLFERTHRTLFKGWIWIADSGFPDVRTWTTLEALVTLSDVTAFLIPVVMAWTVLLLLLRMRSPRPTWRRIWRQPGMAACLAALVGAVWSVLVLLSLIGSIELGLIPHPSKPITADRWAQKFLSDELFMYAGLAVAAVWFVQLVTGRWRRSVDWIDTFGRIVRRALDLDRSGVDAARVYRIRVNRQCCDARTNLL